MRYGIDPFTVSGTGKQVRDVLHGDDMKQLYFSAIKNIDVARGQAFNIGGGIKNSLSLLELFKILENIAKVKLDFIKIPVRESDQRVFVSNIEKAKSLLNWQPQVSSSDGIERMFNWIVEGNK